jgi:DNA end-binding protein Ku
MARAVWTGDVRFGLVSIPVALYPATEPKDVRFHLFDREGRRVRYRRVVEEGSPVNEVPDPPSSVPGSGEMSFHQADEALEPVDEPTADRERAGSTREVEYADTVRGYEVEPDQYVFLERAELEQVRPGPSRSIELEDFVALHDVDPVYFEKSYVVVPRGEASKPYALLRAVLEQTNRVGIGRFVLRTKPHLVAIRPTGDSLALETLFFGDEVRDAGALVGGVETNFSDRELAMAEQLVGMLATEWDPSGYTDEYRQELLSMIAQRTPERVEAEHDAERDTGASAGSNVGELMDALRRSVEAARAERDRPDARPGTRAI